MKYFDHHRRRFRGQRGYLLMVLIFMMALMMLAVTAIAPRVAQQTKRDREEEMIHRGAQYARAIKRFYRKFGRYPNTIEQLENTNNLRFLRKQYKDPMAEDGKWKFLHPGDVKIGGANVGTPVSTLASGTQQPTGLGTTNPTSPTGASGLSRPSTSRGGAANSQIGGFIIGVASVSEAEGIHEFDNKNHYNEWYFVYDPTTDRGALINGPYTGKTFGNSNSIPGATPAGQQPGGFGQPITPGGVGQPTSPGGFGQPIGGPGASPSPPKQ
jgi:type II secretory pathway pseudopilin PulG